MATISRIPLPALAWTPLDGSVGKAAPTQDYFQCTGAGGSPRYARQNFAPAVDQFMCATFELLEDYVANMVFKFSWYAAATNQAQLCDWWVFINKVSEGGAIETLGIGAGVEDCVPPHEMTLRLNQETVNLAEGGAAKGDVLMITLARQGTEAIDEMAGDAHFVAGTLEYDNSE